MDTRQLQTFITLAQCRNYQRAAEQLHYAPSSLFKHIQLLEEELGVVLFIKNARQLELTSEGQRFLPDARRLLDEWEAVLGHVRGSQNVPALSIGGCELNLSFALREMLQQYVAAYPDVRLNVTTSPNVDAPSILRHDQAELCFYYSRTARKPSGLEALLLCGETVTPSVPEGHPLLDRESVSWADLAACPVVHPHDSCVFFETFMQQMKSRGLAPARVSFPGNMLLVIEQARREQGIMLVPSLARRSMEENGIRPLSFRDDSLHFRELLLYRRDAEDNPYLKHMLRFAARYADAQIAARPELMKTPPKREYRSAPQA